MNKLYITVFIYMLISISYCDAQTIKDSLQVLLKNKYSYEGKGNSMSLWFVVEKGVVYIKYINVAGNGKYINEVNNDDPKDNGGHFALKESKEYNLILKSFYNREDIYHLNLKFDLKNKQIKWFIKEKVVAYLPKSALFIIE